MQSRAFAVVPLAAAFGMPLRDGLLDCANIRA